MKIYNNFPSFFLVILAVFFTSFTFSQKLPILSKEIQVSYPDSNPLKEALQPIPETAIFEMEGYSLWDPSVIKVGKIYHLFCSRWSEKKGWDTWKKSHIIRATSKFLFGPYTFKEVVMIPSEHPWAKQGLHNPKITKIGDQFLLYHLGIPGWKTGFMFSDSIEGPWKPVEKSILRTNNPSLLIRDDKSIYAVGKFKPSKKNTKDGRWDAYMNSFEASNIKGPFEKISKRNNCLPGDFELEDPTVWWVNNQYNVICTDWEAKVTGIERSLLLYTSKDGIDYHLYSQIPIWDREKIVPVENNKSFKPKKIERPQVYLNKKGELTALLVAATRYIKQERGIILIRPVDHFVPDN